MAKNRQAQDAAAKAKKQKTMLVVFGVALLAVGVLQGPKLLKQLNPPAPEAAAVVDGSTAVPPAATPVPGQTPTIVQVQRSAPQRTAILAGVTLSSDSLPAADDDQLRSFSLFVVKDPFVQQSSEEDASATPAPAAVPPPAAATTDTTAADAAKTSTPPQPTPTDATITMNGQAYALTVKDAFPKNDPLFVLAGLKPKLAKIGVAGGSFEDGKTIPLKLGKPVTLVNDATGARYSIKLVYLGVGPEKTQSFTQTDG